MIGMGDKKEPGLSALILRIKKPGVPEKAEELDPKEMLEMCAKRVLAAISANDADLLVAELPKLIRMLPSPEEGEY